MHKCSKCGRAASSLEEIDAGCPCGSKVFVFDRQIAQAVAREGNGGAADGNGGFAVAGGNGGEGAMAPIAAAEGGSGAVGAANGGNGNSAAADIGAAPSSFAVPQTAKNRVQEGKVPESYFARTSFTDDDVENIKVLTQGVFLLDVNAISKNPVVLKDEDEIYYVKLPLVQKKETKPAPGKEEEEGNGKK